MHAVDCRGELTSTPVVGQVIHASGFQETLAFDAEGVKCFRDSVRTPYGKGLAGGACPIQSLGEIVVMPRNRATWASNELLDDRVSKVIKDTDRLHLRCDSDCRKPADRQPLLVPI